MYDELMLLPRLYVIACTVADWPDTLKLRISECEIAAPMCPTFGQRGTSRAHLTNPLRTHKNSYPLPSGSSAPSSVQCRPGPSVLL
jgi:hypothetical protein